MCTWKQNDLGGYTRCDGATVYPRRTMWGAWGPTDNDMLAGKNGQARHWKTAEAAMLAVEDEFPVSEPKPLDRIAARVVAEMAAPHQECRRNVREAVSALISGITGRSASAAVAYVGRGR